MKWDEESYNRKDENGNIISLEDYQQQDRASGFSKVMTKNDLKLYAICGVGFMIDAYDLFIINLATPIWMFEYWQAFNSKSKTPYPLLLHGAVNAAANIGNVIGQIGFGFMGDVFGRKFVYGKELIIAIVGIILLISVPNHMPGPTKNKFWYIFGMRVLMGIGIGGDYPMSAAIVAERTSLRNRGRMLGWIFSNQGWGNLLGSVVTIILLLIFSPSLSNGHYGSLDAVWRLQFGLIIVPCAITLYFRLTMPESRKFMQSGELSTISSTANSSATTLALPPNQQVTSEKHAAALAVEQQISHEDIQASRWTAFSTYFSEWRHLKVLIGTASTWFLVDVAFYGINLNQSVLLGLIGFAKGRNEYHTLLITAFGNLIIAAAGYVPGYFFTIAFIEIIGRKPIQIGGFIITALMFAIIAGDYTGLGVGGKFACFTIAQFFFNFGPNATTFIVPGEVYPSRVRGLAHGLSAAIGKLGAILSGILFNWLSSRIGVAKVLWIFFATDLLGAIMTWFFVPETKGMDADAIDYAETMEKLAARGAMGGMGGVATGNAGYEGQQHDYATGAQGSAQHAHGSDPSIKTEY